MRKLLLVALAVMLLLSGCSQATEPETNSGDPPAADTRPYNLEKYRQIEMGDSYAAVAELLGNPGEALVDGDRLDQYIWENEDGSNISVTFYDDQVTGRSQAYLAAYLTDGAKVTLAQYDRVEEGMELAEVEEILGEGTETLLSEEGAGTKAIYGWHNSDGGSIGVTFVGGVVTDKTEMMLK